jgi:lipoprotein signal peptidase
MKLSSQTVWVLLRLLVIIANLGIGFSPKNKSNLDWGACILISIAVSVSLFLWLLLIRHRQNVDWSKPYGWDKPFWPMRKYPLRFWSLISLSTMISGAIAFLIDVIEENGNEAFGGTFFFMGLSIGISLRVWLKFFGKGLIELNST